MANVSRLAALHFSPTNASNFQRWSKMDLVFDIPWLWQVAQMAQIHYQPGFAVEDQSATAVAGHLPSQAAERPSRLQNVRGTSYPMLAAAVQPQAHPGGWQTTLRAPYSKSEPQVSSFMHLENQVTKTSHG